MGENLRLGLVTLRLRPFRLNLLRAALNGRRRLAQPLGLAIEELSILLKGRHEPRNRSSLLGRHGPLEFRILEQEIGRALLLI
eukprot:scaffold714_cov121-Isochrysis_galbana.AAC.20